ncbi:MAG TPA: glutamate racemase [bacterium]|uniref:Glutamate racemase n=1 Tax=candidate division TA06 bacterium ADurb.Bin417 TaxID=1852828 RepID=A0A1V5MK59_UNCT6|nr:MAG: Glutamate racemase [candidate division TA06 bacterium ADurb.Bin417]HNQ34725.1 glutamate racemase [bacterium]HNS48659.1 glutamate racemase [bacterium]
MNDLIGVFDSGLGGLTVVYNIQRALPKNRVVYLGDTARLPYGTKSPETVNLFARQDTRFLLPFAPRLIVVACHTVSALALKNLKRDFLTSFVGMLEPGVRAALKETRHGRIGVIGTSATVKSGAYARELTRRNPRLKVFSQACPLFVPLVEEGFLSGPVTEQVIAQYLAPLKRKKVDTVILGCTHYPMLKREIGRFLGDGVALIDPSEAVVEDIRLNLAGQPGRPVRTTGAAGTRSGRKLQIYLTDLTPNFRRVAKAFLGKPILNLRKVGIDEN